MSEDVGSRSRQAQFCLRPELIPSYIPVRVAERILFVGESVQMFESEKQGTKHHYKGESVKEGGVLQYCPKI